MHCCTAFCWRTLLYPLGSRACCRVTVQPGSVKGGGSVPPRADTCMEESSEAMLDPRSQRQSRRRESILPSFSSCKRLSWGRKASSLSMSAAGSVSEMASRLDASRTKPCTMLAQLSEIGNARQALAGTGAEGAAGCGSYEAKAQLAQLCEQFGPTCCTVWSKKESRWS